MAKEHWRQRQSLDKYFLESKAKGFRSRSAFKLQEIDQKMKLFSSNTSILDLGSTPGGWSQYAAKTVLPKGRIIALDVLEMESLDGVEFIQGDFTEDIALQQLLGALGAGRADLVLSDLAPNISGMRSVDQPRSMYLVELALELAIQILAPGGSFITKVFQGEGFDELLAECRKRFKTVRVRKPAASRQESRETYIVASGFRV